MELRIFFDDTFRQLSLPPEEHWHAVESDYAGRAYHNLDHLREMLRHLEAHRTANGGREIIRQPAVFGVALIYHDIIYRAHRSDNEQRSADAATNLLRHSPTMTDGDIFRCQNLIMVTKNHLPTEDDNGDENLLIDLDLAVLARPAAEYDAYAAAVRKEFWMYPNLLYRPGRKRALESFLRRESIYHTEFGKAKYEEAARANIEREISGL